MHLCSDAFCNTFCCKPEFHFRAASSFTVYAGSNNRTTGGSLSGLVTEKTEVISLGFFYLSLTMSAELTELTKSQFVRRPYVHVAIISEPNVRISFRFWLLLPLGHTFGRFFLFFFLFFTNIFYFRSHGTLWEWKFQIATPTNRRRKFSNFSWIFFLMVLTKLPLGLLKFWKLKF